MAPVGARRCHRTELRRYITGHVCPQATGAPRIAPATLVVLADLLENLIAKMATDADQCRAHARRLTVKPHHAGRVVRSMPLVVHRPRLAKGAAAAGTLEPRVRRLLFPEGRAAAPVPPRPNARRRRHRRPARAAA